MFLIIVATWLQCGTEEYIVDRLFVCSHSLMVKNMLCTIQCTFIAANKIDCLNGIHFNYEDKEKNHYSLIGEHNLIMNAISEYFMFKPSNPF